MMLNTIFYLELGKAVGFRRCFLIRPLCYRGYNPFSVTKKANFQHLRRAKIVLVCQISTNVTKELTDQHEKHIYINNFELPQVLDAVQGAVATRQEVVQILSKTQSFQP